MNNCVSFVHIYFTLRPILWLKAKRYIRVTIYESLYLFVWHVQAVMEVEPVVAGGVTGSNSFLEFPFGPSVDVIRDGPVFETS